MHTGAFLELLRRSSLKDERSYYRLSRTTCHPMWLCVQGKGNEQLYDLVRDPGETRNHAREHPDVLETMRAALTKERAAHAAVAL